MKNSLFVALVLWTGVTHACDICGSSSATGAMGLLPRLSGHFAGLRCLYASYQSRTHGSEPSRRDDFLSYEALGRYMLTSRWTITASLPFQSVFQKSGEGKSNYHQMGDASLMAGYLYSFKTGKSGPDQTFYAAAGVKFPTGSRELVKDGNKLPPGLQPGSGSLDWLAMLAWNRFGKTFGLGAESSCRLARPNADHYALGHRFGASAKAYYRLSRNSNEIWSSLGLDAEVTSPDRWHGESVEQTGGRSLLLNAGINLLAQGGMNLGLTAQLPLAQRLNEGFTRSSVRASLQFFYFF